MIRIYQDTFSLIVLEFIKNVINSSNILILQSEEMYLH
jgi:hypothetical protein